jgi:hypothetical protein
MGTILQISDVTCIKELQKLSQISHSDYENINLNLK